MLLEYTCSVCARRHRIATGDPESNAMLGEIKQHAQTLFVRSVVKAYEGASYSANNKRAKVARAKGDCETIEVSARNLNKMLRALENRDGDPPELVAGRFKMLGTLIVTHTDAVQSKLVAESGKPEIFEAKQKTFQLWRIADAYISKEEKCLFGLFSSEPILHAKFPALSEQDFTTNCAATKLLLAVAHDRLRHRSDARQPPEYLKSSAPIKTLALTERLFRPPGLKVPISSRQYTRVLGDGEESQLYPDFAPEGEDAQEQDDNSDLARPCDRCRIKVPAIICPIANRVSGKRFEEAVTCEI